MRPWGWYTSGVTSRLWLPPLLVLLSACQPKQDDLSAQLQAMSAGKEVWVYGGGPLRCVLDRQTAEIVFPITSSVQVVKAELLPNFGKYAVEIGTNGHLPAQLITSPIVLTLKPRTAGKTVSSSRGTLAPWQTYLQGRSCQEFKVAFVNQAHLERTLSLKAPSSAHLALVKRMGTEMGFGRSSRLGLTHEQVLWLQGPPDEPQADFATLMQADRWTVMGEPGYGDWVLVFKGDKVVGESAPSPMP